MRKMVLQKTLLLSIMFLVAQHLNAQDMVIKGRVLDSLTRKPVSFASVVSKTQGRGTTANVDGNFSFTIKKAGEELQVSSINYKRRTVKAAEGFNEIYLSAGGANMETIVIKNKDSQDPYALSIIKKSINNRKNNDPEELNSYSYNTYSKGIVDTIKSNSIKKASGVSTPQQRDSDTGRYQFLVESVFEHKYKKPGLHSNRMTAQRVSGLSNPYILGLVTQVQYFSFYADDFKVLGASYQNPVSNKYFRSYIFSLIDSITGNDGKLTYIISFRPRYKSMGLNLMRGQVHIHEGDYAVVNVEASAFYPGSTSSIAFKQNYEVFDGHWFPKQLQTQLMLLPDDNDSINDGALKFNVTSYLNEIKIEPEIKRSAFGNYAMTVDENSGTRSEAYWREKREMPLDKTEMRTYVYIDSVFKADTAIRKAQLKMDVLGYLVKGKWPIGNINIDLGEIIKLNDYETVRLGLGLSTNERFSEKFKIGVSGGYGFRDNAWKYGAYFEYKPSREADLVLGVSYRKDIALWGMSNLLQPGIRARNYQYLLNDRADDVKKMEVYTKFRFLKIFDAVAFVNWQDREFNHGYGYALPKDPTLTYVGAGIVETGLKFSTRFKQGLLKYGNFTWDAFGKDDPRLAFDIRAGRSADNADGISYIRMEGLYENFLALGRLGKLKYNISGGYISGETPYSMLFSNLGTGRRSFDLFVPSTFQTMKPLEFTNTAYAALYTEFESGFIIQKRKKFGISLFIPNSVGIGSYEQEILHRNVSTAPLNNLYAETGLGLKYRTRKRMIGFAAMYRYGFYKAADFGDNLSFRILVER